MIALLTSTLPVLRCVVHTDLDVSFSLGSSEDEPSRPNIKSLSMLIDANTSVESEYELLFFPPDTHHTTSSSNLNVRGSEDMKIQNPHTLVLNEIRNVERIEERLNDAATNDFRNECKLKDEQIYHNPIEKFLQRSEAIICELIHIMHQYPTVYYLKPKHNSSSTSSKLHSHQSVHLSAEYFFHLSFQLDTLNSFEIESNTTIIESINDELNQITLVCTDEKDRKHKLRLELSPLFPLEPPIIISDLPIGFYPKWKVDSRYKVSEQTNNVLLKDCNKSYIFKNINATERRKVSADCASSLPLPFVHDQKFDSDPHSYDYGLVHLYRYFDYILSSLQFIWNELDDIDANMLVLEPSLPARYSSTKRRIALQTNISVTFALNLSDLDLPGNDNDIPKRLSPPSSIRFTGAPSSTIKELIDKYNGYINTNNNEARDSIEVWNQELSYRENFMKCFGTIPSQQRSEVNEYVAECGICYTYRLPLSSFRDDVDENENEGEDSDGKNDIYILPDEICGNPKCARSYHESCLYEWFKSLPSTRVSFDRMIGSCPYCCEALSMKLRLENS